MSREAAVAALAARQHALVTLEQARDCGFTDDAVRHQIRAGRRRRLRHGVFVVNGAPESWEQAVLGAVLASGPEAVASHVTAGVLWGLPNLQHEVTFHVSVAQLGVATDFARRERDLRLADLQRCVVGLPPGPGRKPTRIQSVFRARLEHHDETESGLEVRVLRAIVGAGLPEPVQQHEVRIGDRRRRLDLVYPNLKLAIEIDGWAHHAPRSAFDADRARENELEIIGWDRLHFTSAFTDRQVGETVAAKLAALGQKHGA